MAEISSLESRNVLRNLVKMSLSSIAYLRNLFEESVFEDAVFGGIPMKCLTRILPESSTLLDWIDYGIYDALSKSFLQSLVIGIHDASNQILEAYTFHLQYSDEWNTSVYPSAADGSRGSNNRGGIDFHRDHIKAQTVNTLRNLILLLQSLSPLLNDSFISMKILYNSNVEEDYEPQYFQRDTLSEDLHQVKFNTNHIIGSVNTGYHVMCIELNTTSLIDELSAELPEADLREAEGEIIKGADGRTNRREWKSRYNGNTIHDCLTLGISPEDTSTVGCLADSSSNYLSLKSIATPRDRGSRGGSDEDVTSSGLPVADLREAEGEVNREGHHGEWKTSGRTSSMRKGSLADVGLYKSLGINGKRKFYSTRNLGVGNMDKAEGAIAGDGIEDTDDMKTENGYIRMLLYHLYITFSTGKLVQVISPYNSEIKNKNKDVITSLLYKAKELSHRYKFINISIISKGLGVDPMLSRVLIKKMIEYDLISRRSMKNKGHLYVGYKIT